VAEHAILIENGCNILRKCGRWSQGPGERTDSKDPKQANPDTRHIEPASVTGGRLALFVLASLSFWIVYTTSSIFIELTDYTRLKMNRR
jgi:hypothetical protein